MSFLSCDCFQKVGCISLVASMLAFSSLSFADTNSNVSDRQAEFYEKYEAFKESRMKRNKELSNMNKREISIHEDIFMRPSDRFFTEPKTIVANSQ